MAQENILQTILDRAGEKKSDLTAVFDLDSTLFDVSPRITKIIQEFAVDPGVAPRFPRECDVLKDIVHHPHDWGVEVTCEKAGLSDAPIEFHTALADYWFERFHSNDYLKYDRPMDGAIEYVQRLHDVGAHIIYLTGRDTERYLEGTVLYLKKHDFPLGKRADHALKPQKDMADAPFKRDFIKTLDNRFSEVWLFENEPVNLNLIANDLPHINLVYLIGAHSGREEPLEDYHHITDFKGFE